MRKNLQNRKRSAWAWQGCTQGIDAEREEAGPPDRVSGRTSHRAYTLQKVVPQGGRLASRGADPKEKQSDPGREIVSPLTTFSTS